MFQDELLEYNCYQIRGILKNKNKVSQKGTQNSPHFASEAVSPIYYEYESKSTTTKSQQRQDQNAIKMGKDKIQHICKCKEQTDKKKTKKSNSPSPTKVVHNQGNNVKNKNISNENYLTEEPLTAERKSRFNLFSKSRGTYKVNPKNKSFINLSRKRNKRKTSEALNKENITSENTNHKIKEIKDMNTNTTKLEKNKKNKKNNSSDRKTNKSKIVQFETRNENLDVIDDICSRGLCKIYRQKQKYHRCECEVKNKDNIEELNKFASPTLPCIECHKYRGTFHSARGEGDEVKKNNRTRNILSARCICKKSRKGKPVEKRAPPMFAVKIDYSNLGVLNAAEIRKKVKDMGNVEKKEFCDCPSRLEKAKLYGVGDTCEAGICERAKKDKYNRFRCKCPKKNIIKCNDSTCDQEIMYGMSTRKGKVVTNYSQNPTTNNPLFKMVLDNNQMNVLNTGEIEHILKTTKHSNMICPTGICNDNRNKRTILECTCISKKIRPDLNECDSNTCRPKRSKFYLLCKRVFSCSDRSFCNRCRSYHPHRRQALELGSSTGQHWSPNRNGQIGTRDNRFRNIAPSGMNNIDCMCNCECHLPKTKATKKKSKKHVKKKRTSIFERDRMHKEFTKKEKKFTKLQKKKAKEEKKKEKKELKQKLKLKKEMQKLQLKEAGESNFLANCLNGTLNLTMQTLRGILIAASSIVFDPINSYLYTKNKVIDPIGTAKTFRRWIIETWKSKDSKISRSITDSDTLNVLADHLEDSVIFQTFADKGRTEAERRLYERKAKLRQRRIRKRKDLALFSCRHMLLTTLRKHPCLWVYHICPSLYPQCLSLLGFCGNFVHLLMYLGALLCWTPCILFMEFVRAFLCCIVCTN